MGIFARDKAQAAAPISSPIEFQPVSVTADELQRIADDWKRAERSFRDDHANKGQQLWAQAQAAVEAKNMNLFVRLGEQMQSQPNMDDLDMKDEIFARIDKSTYTPGMIHVVEMIRIPLEADQTYQPQQVEPETHPFDYQPISQQ